MRIESLAADPPPTIEIENAGSIDGELARIFGATVSPVAYAISLLFLMGALAHPFVIPAPQGHWLAAISLLSALMLAPIGYTAKPERMSPAGLRVAGFAVIVITLLNNGAILWGTNNAIQSTNFALILAGIGLFFLSRFWFFLALATTISTWAVVIYPIATPDEFVHYAFMLAMAASVSGLTFALRVRTHRRLIRTARRAQLYAMVERESKAKTEFLANMSHELRTPLNAIIGFSEIMATEMLGPHSQQKYRDYANDILYAGQNLLTLVGDVLDLSRIQLEGMPLSLEPIDAPKICRNCLKIVQARAEKNGLSIHFEADDDIRPIETDERKVKQVFVNLMTNAIKFTPPGGRITVRCEETDGDELLISVSDTGIGMTQEEIRHAFLPFWQADSRLERLQEGAGLGLPLSKELLRLVGGQLEISSTPGRGTTCTVRLPYAPPADLVEIEQDGPSGTRALSDAA